MVQLTKTTFYDPISKRTLQFSTDKDDMENEVCSGDDIMIGK